MIRLAEVTSSFTALATAASLLLNVLDCALLEKGPCFERFVSLLHALFEFFEHLLPPVRIGLFVVIHRLDKRHVEVLRGKFALLQKLFVVIEVVNHTFGALAMTSIDCNHLLIVIRLLTVLKVVIIIASLISILSVT